jgi:hypothetical protein
MILFEKEKERNRTCKVAQFRNLMKERCVSCVATETLTKCKAPSTYIQLQIFYHLILYGFNKLSKGYKTRTHKAGTSLVLGRGKGMNKHVPLLNGTQLSFIQKGGFPFSTNKITIGMMLTLQTQFAFVLQQQQKCHSYCMLLVPPLPQLFSLSLSLFPIRNSRAYIQSPWLLKESGWWALWCHRKNDLKKTHKHTHTGEAKLSDT